jgi:hypothetical protein
MAKPHGGIPTPTESGQTKLYWDGEEWHNHGGDFGNSNIGGACIPVAAGRAYARKMEPDPKETPDFSAFSKMRRIQLDPESVIGRELHDRFAEFDESFTGHSRIWSVVVKLIGLTAMCSRAVIDLEKQVIELRREVRSRDKE